jgi:signal transduction histidine kinase
VRIAVADEGPGLPAAAEDLRTGLGLRIARAVAQAHGGTLELGNRSEGGARTGLSLPAR